MNKSFDFIRVYIDEEDNQEIFNNIEFVLSKKAIIKNAILLTTDKRCMYSRLNDERLVLCPQNYDEFIECLKDTKFCENIDGFLAYRIIKSNKQFVSKIEQSCSFDMVMKFAKKYLADHNWDRLRKEYLIRSFDRSCYTILNDKRNILAERNIIK